MSIFPNQEGLKNPTTIDDQATVKMTKGIVHGYMNSRLPTATSTHIAQHIDKWKTLAHAAQHPTTTAKEKN